MTVVSGSRCRYRNFLSAIFLYFINHRAPSVHVLRQLKIISTRLLAKLLWKIIANRCANDSFFINCHAIHVQRATAARIFEKGQNSFAKSEKKLNSINHRQFLVFRSARQLQASQLHIIFQNHRHNNARESVQEMWNVHTCPPISECICRHKMWYYDIVYQE